MISYQKSKLGVEAQIYTILFLGGKKNECLENANIFVFSKWRIFQMEKKQKNESK